MEKTVVCRDLFEKEVVVSVEDLVPRVSVYGLFFNEEGQLLVVTTSGAGTFFLVGGEIELGETPEEALIREAKEEAGVEVEVELFFTAGQAFFYYNSTDEAYQNVYLIYIGRVVNFQDFSQKFNVKDDLSEDPEFVDVADVKKENSHSIAYQAIQDYIASFLVVKEYVTKQVASGEVPS